MAEPFSDPFVNELAAAQARIRELQQALEKTRFLHDLDANLWLKCAERDEAVNERLRKTIARCEADNKRQARIISAGLGKHLDHCPNCGSDAAPIPLPPSAFERKG